MAPLRQRNSSAQGGAQQLSFHLVFSNVSVTPMNWIQAQQHDQHCDKDDNIFPQNGLSRALGTEDRQAGALRSESPQTGRSDSEGKQTGCSDSKGRQAGGLGLEGRLAEDYGSEEGRPAADSGSEDSSPAEDSGSEDSRLAEDSGDSARRQADVERHKIDRRSIIVVLEQ
ncbi:hypothetical protein NDU88_001678 [Pleurodeles waltl]|uniref:Uncharacterized protein n=1 Tax=Pleurodeles waltl TaxID=8319 RepID=A0AAV7VX63_PLEWA|nr:hypothetical protein NDU88_001678 [Pleurodeles waltl]